MQDRSHHKVGHGMKRHAPYIPHQGKGRYEGVSSSLSQKVRLCKLYIVLRKRVGITAMIGGAQQWVMSHAKILLSDMATHAAEDFFFLELQYRSPGGGYKTLRLLVSFEIPIL